MRNAYDKNQRRRFFNGLRLSTDRFFSAPELWLLFFALLNFQYSLQSALQQSVLSSWLWFPLFFGLTCLVLFRLPRILKSYPQLIVWGIVFVIYVRVSGYYPERDNDGISFWMPKARALQLYGFLPNVSPTDPRFTISHNYPLGGIALSAWMHSFFAYFDVFYHRCCMAFQSWLLWWAFFQRTTEMGLSRFGSNLLMLLLVGIQPAIWTHGYLDATWSLAAVLGLSFLLFEKDGSKAFAYLAFATGCKMEAAIILAPVVGILALKERQWKWLACLLPAAVWFLVAQSLGLYQSRQLSATPHSLAQLTHEIAVNTWPLLKFQTLYGATSVVLYLALKGVWGLRWKYLWIPLFAMGIYAAAYLFSTFDLAWNVKFSWARLLLFPTFFIILTRFFQDSDLIEAA